LASASKNQGRDAVVLGYRSAGTGPPRIQRILAELATSETLGAAAIIAKIAIGIPLTLIGPLLVTIILVSVAYRFDVESAPGFTVMFLLVAAVTIPLLMWYERRSRGEFFSDSMQGETSPYAASSYGEYKLQSTKLQWIAYVEIALTGPRLLWEAIDWLRGATPVDQALRMTAADIVAELLDAGQGKPIRDLARPDRSARDVHRAVQYLVRRDWAGISSRKDRIWLASNVQERLARL
jgi:hypothetical protein